MLGALALSLSGCSTTTYKNANNLPNNLTATNPYRANYNCGGCGIGKEFCYTPTGYKCGMSTEEAFKLVVNDIGETNIRKLTSIYDEIEEDEWMVAFKCGDEDFHFIRRTDDGKWYNKRGGTDLIISDDAYALSDVWVSETFYINGKQYITNDPIIYDDDTVFFALKKDWSVNDANK